MLRIVVFGASGSGKTTLARWLGDHLALPFTDLDDLHWRPGWVEAPTEPFRAAVDHVTREPCWVIAGNYAKARDLTWARADTLIWLDLRLPHVLWRSASRAVRQWRTREPVCNGNRQTLANIVNGGDSLLGYTLRTYHARRREWPLLLQQHAHAKQFRLRSQREIDLWRAGLQAGKTPVDR
jgi:hypothetical protein